MRAPFPLPRPLPRPGKSFWVVLVLAIGLRAALLPIPNTDNDIVFQTWSRMVTVEGFHRIYDVYVEGDVPPRECQYPPGYLYVLWSVGNAYRALVSGTFDPKTIELLMLLRVPTVLADLALAVILFFTIGAWWGRRAGHFGFAAYALAPAMILDSTIVTQIDSVQILLMVGTILLVVSGRGALAITCLALAALTKPQSAVLAPLVAVAVWRREGLGSILKGGLGAIGVFLALSLPFFLNGRTFELFRMLTSFVGVAPFLSLNAYNLWWATTGANGWQPDTETIFGLLTYRQLGLVLLGSAAGLALWRVWRDPTRDSILLAALWTTFAFFMLPTEMTERYVLVVLPLALLLAPRSIPYRVLYGLFFVTTFVNLYLVFPIPAISPGAALELPHSNFHFYLSPAHGPPLPVLAPWAEPGEFRPGHEFLPWKWLSLGVALLHLLILGWLATRLWPRGSTPRPVGADFEEGDRA